MAEKHQTLFYRPRGDGNWYDEIRYDSHESSEDGRTEINYCVSPKTFDIESGLDLREALGKLIRDLEGL
jgi:hypothetical protein